MGIWPDGQMYVARTVHTRLTVRLQRSNSSDDVDDSMAEPSCTRTFHQKYSIMATASRTRDSGEHSHRLIQMVCRSTIQNRTIYPGDSLRPSTFMGMSACRPQQQAVTTSCGRQEPRACRHLNGAPCADEKFFFPNPASSVAKSPFPQYDATASEQHTEARPGLSPI